MRTTVPCPSNLALEQYLLGELATGLSHVGDHVATCETCRTKIAEKVADSAAFASSPGAAEVKTALSSQVRAPTSPTPLNRTPAALRASALIEAGAPRQRIFAALGLAAALALAFILTLRRAPSTSSPNLPVSAPSSRAEEANDETAVLRVQREWMEAIRDKDAAALDRILADDYTYTDSRGAVSNKADSLRQARASGGRMTAYQTSDEKTRIYGDLAIVTGRLRVEGVAGGEAYDADVRFTDILARIDGQWRAVAAHASKPTGR